MPTSPLSPNGSANPIGFHYFPDEAHYRDLDLHAWLPELRALGATWLTLTASTARAIPEAFIRGLKSAGIEPIVHINAGTIRRLEPAVLRPLLRAYAGWGVRYVVVFSEPNSRASWPAADWGKPSLVERALDAILPILQLEAEAGLVPVFPALKPGGDYWDTAFLNAALEGLMRRSNATLLSRLAFGFYAYTRNRPVEWGKGGPARWPNARPYLTPPGSQDHLGLHIVDWYDAIIRSKLGGPRPLLCIAGGGVLGECSDPAYPPLDEARHEACNMDVMREIQSGSLPASVLNINFWLLASEATGTGAKQAWYRPDGTTLPIVASAKKRVPKASPLSKSAVSAGLANGHFPQEVPATQNGHGSSLGKSLFHYVLLPTYEWGVSDWHWNAVREYVKAFRPACGFSVDEALGAEHVTIVGNEQGVPAHVEQTLSRAGCRVERIAGLDGAAIEASLAQRVQSGRRFAQGD